MYIFFYYKSKICKIMSESESDKVTNVEQTTNSDVTESVPKRKTRQKTYWRCPCGFESTLKHAYLRHCERKRKCQYLLEKEGVQTASIDDVKNEINFKKIDDLKKSIKYFEDNRNDLTPNEYKEKMESEITKIFNLAKKINDKDKYNDLMSYIESKMENL